MSLSKRMLESRRSVRGAKRGVLPFELSLDSFDSDQKALRVEDKSVTREYNKEVEEWSADSRRMLRTNIAYFVENDIALSDSIRDNVYYNRRGGKEAQRVGFSFLREGVYIHKGAGRGQGGVIGGSWIDRHGKRKTRAASSAGKMGKGNRYNQEWFDTVIDRKLPQLADVVSNYSATLQVNATRIYVDR